MALETVGVRAVVEGLNGYVSGAQRVASSTDQMSAAAGRAERTFGLTNTQLLRLGAAIGGTQLGISVMAHIVSGISQTIQGAVFGLNAQLETAQLQFETLTGSATEARTHVADLFEFAKSTPFETAPIIEASRLLRTFGQAALDTKANLTLVGDAAAATNAPINELAFLVGRMYTAIQAGRPFGEAALRLQELAVLTSDARNRMEDMQKQGADAGEVWAVLTTDLGRFGGAMEKQADTFQGLSSTFKDALAIMAAEATRPAFEQGKETLRGLIDVLASPEAQTGATAFGNSLAFAIKAGVELGATLPAVALALGSVAAAMLAAKVAGAALTFALFQSTAAFAGLAAVAMTPMGALIALGVAVGVVDFAVRKFTGSGIIGHLTGSAGASDRAAAAAAKYGDAVERVNRLVAAGVDPEQARQTVGERTLSQLAAETAAYERAAEQAKKLGFEFPKTSAGQEHLLKQIDALNLSWPELNEFVSTHTDLQEELRPQLEEAAQDFADLQAAQEKAADARLIKEWGDSLQGLGTEFIDLGDVMTRWGKLTDEQKKHFTDFASTVAKAIESVLPSIDQTYSEWRKQLLETSAANANFKDNIAFIHAALVNQNAETADAITKVIAAKGPLEAAQWKKFFVDNPQAAIDLASVVLPPQSGKVADDVILEWAVREETARLAATPLGRALVDGTLAGMLAGQVKLIGAGVRMIAETIAAMRAEAGAQSPSREMMTLGQDMAEGLALGLINGMNELARLHGVQDALEEQSRALRIQQNEAKLAGQATDALDEALDQLSTRLGIVRDQMAPLEQMERALGDAMRQAADDAREAQRGLIDATDFVADAIKTALRRQAQAQLDVTLSGLRAQEDALRASVDRQVAEIDRLAEARVAPLRAELAAMDDAARAETRADIERRLALAYDATERARIEKELRDFDRQERRRQLEGQIRGIEEAARAEQQAAKDNLDAQVALLKQQEDAAKATFDRITDAAALEQQARLLLEGKHQEEIIKLLQSFYPEWETAGFSLGEQLIAGLKRSGIEAEIARILSRGGGGGGGGGGGNGARPAGPVDLVTGAPVAAGGAPKAVYMNGVSGVLLPDGTFVPQMQHGGIVLGPTLALLGERRPEAVIPLDRLESIMASLPGSLSAGRGGWSFAVDLRGSTFTGTPQENAGAIEGVVEGVIERHLGRGAYLSGAKP